METPQASPAADTSAPLTAAFAAMAALIKANMVVDVGMSPAGEKLVATAPNFALNKLAPVDAVLPANVKATETLVDPESFAEYVNRFKTPASIAKASLSGRSIEAVLDYHGESGGTKSAPGYAQHRVTLKSEFSEDWLKWSGMFGDWIAQEAYGEFIDDMAHTIARPVLAELLEVVRTVDIERSVKLKSKTNPQSGAIQVTYEEVDSNGVSGPTGQVSIPTEIYLLLPVFQGTPALEVRCKLKFKLERGHIVFSVTVPGVDKLIRDEFGKLALAAAEATGIPVYLTA